MPTSMLISALLVLVVVATIAVLADHHVCSWTGPGDDPESAGFTQYCDAFITEETDTTARYVCEYPLGVKRQVADYGFLGSQLLEFGTACNDGGYLTDVDNNCCCSHIAVCLGIRDAKTKKYPKCYAMSVWDDCQWPDVIEKGKKPRSVHIWKLEKPKRASGVGKLRMAGV